MSHTTEEEYQFPEIIKGCWQLSKGHGPPKEMRAAVSDLAAFLRAGYTTFDCADIYTGAEDMLGILREQYPDLARTMRVHTKFVPDLDILSIIRKTDVEAIIDRSLRRLKMERLDLVQFHWWDFSIPRHVETALYLQELQQAGKIRHIGVTNYDVSHLRELVDAGVRIVSNQVQYSVLDQRPEHGMSDYCGTHGIKLLCYGTVAGGFLANRFLNYQEPQEPFDNRSMTKYKLVIDDAGGWAWFRNLLGVLNHIGERYSVGVSEVATRFVLQQPSVASAIVGSSSRLIASLRATENFVLSDDDLRNIRGAIERGSPLTGDIYSLERDRTGKHGSIMRYSQNRL